MAAFRGFVARAADVFDAARQALPRKLIQVLTELRTLDHKMMSAGMFLLYSKD